MRLVRQTEKYCDSELHILKKVSFELRVKQ